MASHFIYILECSDGTLYTGYTNNLEKRLETHNASKGAKYTRMRLPVRLVYEEHFDTKSAAMQREYAIKQLTRQQKIKLIQGGTL
ncbi:GIY-YIG nuclease family protein [Macrococcus animalis]|uniref:GIY-YIG nuclease family protein n=1 Tax=Macrococcus animalis TaxID=3395467 RepID=UPI0039BF7685